MQEKDIQNKGLYFLVKVSSTKSYRRNIKFWNSKFEILFLLMRKLTYFFKLQFWL